MASSNGAFPVAPGNNPITRMPSLTTARLLSVQDLDPRNLEPQNLNRQDLEPQDPNQQDRNHGDYREIQETNQVTPSRRSNGQYNPDRLECIQEREHALRTYDLEEGHFKMPGSVADVYNDHVKVKGRMGNLTQVRKLVRSVIFPKMKFVTNEATFSQPVHISEKSVQHDFLVGMNKQFMKFCLIHVVGLTRMTKMGENYAEKDRLSFKEAITSTDESFAILLLEDRWLLWRKIAVLRGEKIVPEEGEDQEPTETDNMGGDEDDLADRDNQGRRIDGTNLTIYSMYGRLARHRKGFNVKHAVMRQNAIKQTIVKPFRTTPRGKLQMKKMRDWWGGEQKGPKRKRQRVEDDDDMNIDNEDNEYGSSEEDSDDDE